MALALSERSLFLNPFNRDAARLNSIVYDQLSEQHSERPLAVPLIFRILDFVPYFLVVALCTFFLALFGWQIGSTVRTERVSFKKQPRLRLQTAGCALTVILSLSLLWFKAESSNQTWACVTSSAAGLYTGPDSSTYSKVGSLASGSCSKVVRIGSDWVSLTPASKSPGWAQKSEVLMVRGNKFDPLFK